MPITDLNMKNGLEVFNYFKNRRLEDLDVPELAYIHLDMMHGRVSLENCTVYSSLYDLIGTARASFNNVRTRIYTPLLSCFAILDQIGGAYGSTQKSTDYGAGVKVALETFGNYSKDEIEKLYALRNGLYHDGSLLNISKNGKAKVIFRLSPNAEKTLTQPENEWDGVYHDEIDNYITLINTKMFKDDVEKIIAQCARELLNGSLTMKINQPKEFFYKFLFVSRD